MTCAVAWSSFGADTAQLLPYFTQHGGPAAPHSCIRADAHPAAVPHACLCGVRSVPILSA